MSDQDDPRPPTAPDAWAALRRLTPARIALGRAGTSLPTRAQLEFQFAHAQARDAVHLPLDGPSLAQAIGALGLDVLPLHSAAADRDAYLQRPDLGRRLDDASAETLRGHAALKARRCDVCLVVADGLSALAVHSHAAPMLQRLRDHARAQNWSLAPVCVVEQGRVAVGDEIAELLGACLCVMLIGERPGLSSPDSLGAYLTFAPRVGLTDAARNCISNIRAAGLSYDTAIHKLAYLMGEAMRRRLSGVQLKDEAQAPALLEGDGPRPGNFLLPETD
ncbi:MAG: ethanolamine ammonia-lyase [Pseudoxanthomonas spadix]|nr:MAG: ethanolamine ammonia-lyase [Pseudoxanthomonas spadix]